MTTVIQETAIKAWIGAVSKFASSNVFQSNGSGERPNGAYATFRFLTGKTSDYAGRKITKKEAPADPLDVVEEFFTRETLTYQIDVYAEDGKHIINKLWLSREIWQIRKLLKAAGITISEKSITRNLTAFQDTGFAPRYSVDITFIGEDIINSETDLGYLNELWDKYKMQGIWAPDIDVVAES